MRATCYIVPCSKKILKGLKFWILRETMTTGLPSYAGGGVFTRRKDGESSFIGNTRQNFFTKLRYNLLLKYANVTSHT